MMVLYAWQEGDKWCLSRFKNEAGRPKNTYESQSKVVEAVNERQSIEKRLKIEWLQP